jgi:phosphate transport system substrate-binding protein
MLPRSVAVALGLGLLLGTAGCGRQRNSVTLAGSTAFQPFAEKLAGEYMDAHPGVSITVQGGGSAVGIQAALSGVAQVGMADLVDLPVEARGLHALVVAKDGIAVVVHPANPVNNLTLEQVRGVFSGAVRNWSEVGGADAPITVVSREAGSGTRTSFEQIVGGIALTRAALVQDSNGTIRETVANYANAVGYLSHGLLSEKIKALDVDGYGCTDEEIAAGHYTLVRPVFLLTREAPEGEVKAFLDFILSPQGQETIRSSGLLPAK